MSASVYLSEAQNFIHTPLPLHSIRAYSTLIHKEKGGEGRVEKERRLDGQQFTKIPT